VCYIYVPVCLLIADKILNRLPKKEHANVTSLPNPLATPGE